MLELPVGLRSSLTTPPSISAAPMKAKTASKLLTRTTKTKTALQRATRSNPMNCFPSIPPSLVYLVYPIRLSSFDDCFLSPPPARFPLHNDSYLCHASEEFNLCTFVRILSLSLSYQLPVSRLTGAPGVTRVSPCKRVFCFREKSSIFVRLRQ